VRPGGVLLPAVRPARDARPVMRSQAHTERSGEQRWPSVATLVWQIEVGEALPGEASAIPAPPEPVDLDRL